MSRPHLIKDNFLDDNPHVKDKPVISLHWKPKDSKILVSDFEEWFKEASKDDRFDPELQLCAQLKWKWETNFENYRQPVNQFWLRMRVYTYTLFLDEPSYKQEYQPGEHISFELGSGLAAKDFPVINKNFSNFTLVAIQGTKEIQENIRHGKNQLNVWGSYDFCLDDPFLISDMQTLLLAALKSPEEEFVRTFEYTSSYDLDGSFANVNVPKEVVDKHAKYTASGDISTRFLPDHT